MPAVRRQNIGRRTRRLTQQYNNRQNEDDEERSHRLEENRSRNATMRVVETEQREQRPRTRRIRNAIRFERMAFNYNPTIEYAADSIVSIGPMSSVCQYCSAYTYVNEAAGLCCASGKLRLPPILPLPEPLASLISGRDPRSKHFLSNIQHYNNCFQMTSFGANVIRPQGFNPTFKVTS